MELASKPDRRKDDQAMQQIEAGLKRVYGEIADEPLPSDIADLAAQLGQELSKRDGSDHER